MGISEKLNLIRSGKKKTTTTTTTNNNPKLCPPCTQVSLETFLRDKELSSLHFTCGQMPLSFSKTIPVLFTGIKTATNDLIFLSRCNVSDVIFLAPLQGKSLILL